MKTINPLNWFENDVEERLIYKKALATITTEKKNFLGKALEKPGIAMSIKNAPRSAKKCVGIYRLGAKANAREEVVCLLAGKIINVWPMPKELLPKHIHLLVPVVRWEGISSAGYACMIFIGASVRNAVPPPSTAAH